MKSLIFDAKSQTITVKELDNAEIAAIQDEQARFEALEAHRQYTTSEASEIILRNLINTADIPDTESVRMKTFYPTFNDCIGQEVKAGFKFTYGNELYKTIQPRLTISDAYPPSIATASLYVRIDETHIGNKYDAIPYESNMELTEGLYYTENNVLYLCTRSTGVPVYNALADLVGIYVEVVGV